MGKKFLSLIIIPHGKSQTRTLSFSKKAAKMALWSAIIAGILLLGLTVDYVRIRLTSQSTKSLLSENQKQKETIQQYENSIGTLEEKVKGFEDYVKKLNLIAGLKSPDTLQNPGVGGDGYVPGNSQLGFGSPPQVSPANIQNIQQKTDDIQNNLHTLVNFFEGQEARLASTPTIWPTIGWPSSGWGWRLDPFTRKQTFHKGLDIAAAFGNPIVATADGFVADVKTDKIFGNSILISHGGGVTSFYGHLSKILVKAGQKVKRGDLIGKIGSTGKALGTHLHYEVHINDKAVNPWVYILEEE